LHQNNIITKHYNTGNDKLFDEVQQLCQPIATKGTGAVMAAPIAVSQNNHLYEKTRRTKHVTYHLIPLVRAKRNREDNAATHFTISDLGKPVIYSNT
jgi:hypothetical protein